MDKVSTKIFVAILLGIMRFISGVLPIKVYCYLLNWGQTGDTKTINAGRRRKVECFFARLQSFGGGVLFATCFLHMIPEVSTAMDVLKDYWNISKENEFPFSELIVCCGFLMVYFVEEFMHWLITIWNDEADKEEQPKLLEVEAIIDTNKIKPIQNNHNLQNGDAKKRAEPKLIHDNRKYIEETINELELKNGNNKNETFVAISDPPIRYIELDNYTPIDDVMKMNLENIARSKMLSRGSRSTRSTRTESLRNSRRGSIISNKSIESHLVRLDTDGHLKEITEEEHNGEQGEKKARRNLRGILIIIAISIHSFFEGLSMGLQEHVTSIWFMFTSMLIHSIIILFGIGFEMIMVGVRTRVIVVIMCVLAICTPIGIVVGLLISLQSSLNSLSKSIAVVSLEGISSGALLYITFFEVLSREKHRRIYRLQRSVFIIAGFLLMVVLQAFK